MGQLLSEYEKQDLFLTFTMEEVNSNFNPPKRVIHHEAVFIMGNKTEDKIVSYIDNLNRQGKSIGYKYALLSVGEKKTQEELQEMCWEKKRYGNRVTDSGFIDIYSELV